MLNLMQPSGLRVHRVALVWLIAFAMIGSAILPTGTLAAAPTRFYAEATGQILAEPFLTYWAENDGYAALGLPISKPVELGDRPTQFFQFGALSERADGRVVRLPAGMMLLTELRDPDLLRTGRRTQLTPPIFDLLAGSPAVANEISGYYEGNGGKERFGAPLGPAYRSGGSLMQWFELARIELRGDQVVQAAIGNELLRELGITAKRQKQGRLLPITAERFRTYRGDGTVAERAGPFEPAHISIPSISVDAAIEQVMIINGAMGIPDDAWKVGWYPSLARPGDRTNVVMAGHLDWYGIGPVVFYNLGRVAPGDPVYVTDSDGSGATYTVTAVYLVEADTNAQTIIADAGQETLTLITCGGAWDGSEYVMRTIVQAVRI